MEIVDATEATPQDTEATETEDMKTLRYFGHDPANIDPAHHKRLAENCARRSEGEMVHDELAPGYATSTSEDTRPVLVPYQETQDLKKAVNDLALIYAGMQDMLQRMNVGVRQVQQLRVDIETTLRGKGQEEKGKKG